MKVLTNAVTGGGDWLVGWLLYFCPDDPAGSGKNKWLFTITEKRAQLATHGQPERPHQAGAQLELGQRGRGDYKPRLEVRRLEE